MLQSGPVDLEEGAVTAACLHRSSPLRVAMDEGWVPRAVREHVRFVFSAREKKVGVDDAWRLAPPRPWILTVLFEGSRHSLRKNFSAQACNSVD